MHGVAVWCGDQVGVRFAGVGVFAQPVASPSDELIDGASVEIEATPRAARLAARFVQLVGDRHEPAVHRQPTVVEVQVAPPEGEELAAS